MDIDTAVGEIRTYYLNLPEDDLTEGGRFTAEVLEKLVATERAKVLSEVEEGLSMLTRYLRSIYRLDHSDGEPPQQMLLEDDVMSVLNQLKEGKC